MALRTAESYIDEYEPNTEYSMYYHQAQIERMIDKAREEAIRECAEKAVAEMEYETYPDGTQTANYENAIPIVNKDSILNLINQIK